MKRAEEFIPLTESAYLILASLVQPQHGYGIMQQAASVGSNGLRLGPGTLYTAIGKLIDQGLIRPARDEAVGAERRKVYRLTPMGLEVVTMECRRIAALAKWGRERLKEAGVTL